MHLPADLYLREWPLSLPSFAPASEPLCNGQDPGERAAVSATHEATVRQAKTRQAEATAVVAEIKQAEKVAAVEVETQQTVEVAAWAS